MKEIKINAYGEHVYYHESGLIFHFSRLVDEKEEASFDITVINLWLPSCPDACMLLVDYCCGEIDKCATDLIKLIDAFVASLTADEISSLIAGQNVSHR